MTEEGVGKSVPPHLHVLMIAHTISTRASLTREAHSPHASIRTHKKNKAQRDFQKKEKPRHVLFHTKFNTHEKEHTNV